MQRSQSLDRLRGALVAAGKAALGRNVNGWDFWHVERDGQPVKLAIIRAEYLAGKRDDAR